MNMDKAPVSVRSFGKWYWCVLDISSFWHIYEIAKIFKINLNCILYDRCTIIKVEIKLFQTKQVHR